MKLKIFLPAIILIALVGTVYGYESFVQLDITSISHACCGTELAQIGGSELYAKICNNSDCSDCQDEVYQGGAIGFQSYLSGKVELQTGKQYYFCFHLTEKLCPATYQWVGGTFYTYSGAYYLDLPSCHVYRLPWGYVSPSYGFQLIGCPYQTDPGFQCWTGADSTLKFAFPFIA